jgi:uncharacterized Zn-binding protein involved in type VI secretion
MADDVFINGLSAVHKGSPGKSIAFPDVNLCPPAPPAGPVPTPLPNVAQAADLAGGATSVTVGGNPIAKKTSHIAKSTGNAMARSTGGGVLTHVVEGKAYFTSFSMNVKVEGQPVPRHLDMMTHNHAAPMPGEAVGTYLGSMHVAGPMQRLVPEPRPSHAKDKPFDYEALVHEKTASEGSFALILRSHDKSYEQTGVKGGSRGPYVVFTFRDVLPAKIYSLLQKVGSLELEMFSGVPFTTLVTAAQPPPRSNLPAGSGEPRSKDDADETPLRGEELDAHFDDFLGRGEK